MKPVDDQTVCYAHCASPGSLFVAVGNCRGQELESSIRAFLGMLPADITRLRVVGVRENAKLLVRCHELRPDIRIEVAGPGVCESLREIKYPSIVVQRMRQCRLSASLGGFHRFAATDLAAYRLVRVLGADAGFSPRVMRCAAAHPAWYDLTFLPTLDKQAAAGLLALLVDPRWFVDLQHPNRISKVHTFLGLTPRVQRRVSAGAQPTTTAEHRCAMVRACWWGVGDDAPDMSHPGNFIWRRCIAVAGDDARAELRASQAFVFYLIRTWQQQIARLTMPHLSDPLFSPERWLRDIDVDEITAYREFDKSRPAS